MTPVGFLGMNYEKTFRVAWVELFPVKRGGRQTLSSHLTVLSQSGAVTAFLSHLNLVNCIWFVQTTTPCWASQNQKRTHLFDLPPRDSALGIWGVQGMSTLWPPVTPPFLSLTASSPWLLYQLHGSNRSSRRRRQLCGRKSLQLVHPKQANTRKTKIKKRKCRLHIPYLWP